MCGLSGFWDYHHHLSTVQAQDILRETTDCLTPRGPDSAGYCYDEKSGLAFGHRRLSIVDLSVAGGQPMASANDRYIIVYNGEIYNTHELRELLAAAGKTTFRGHSDTEVLIECIDSFGVEETLRQLNGLFAFAVYDRAEACLYLARDQIGIKPLYWAHQNGMVFFASTLKPIMAHPQFDKELNAACLPDYFSYNTIPAPQTILKDCYKVKPGCFLSFRAGENPVEKRYWQVPAADQGADIDFHALLRDAVKRQMMADVPLGVFLSGGIDSSLITALMQSQSDRPVQSFTIGFEETTYDESAYAATVAKHLGTHHTQEILSIGQAKDLIVDLPDSYDEPFADSSQLPSMLLCRMAQKSVTVCLSGDGGDELFAGYDRYFYGQRAYGMADIIAGIPGAAGALSCLSGEWVNRLPMMPDNMGTKLAKLVSMARCGDAYARNKIMVDLWGDINPAVGNKPVFAFEAQNYTDAMDAMRRADMQCYLPDDILHKMDRASMAHSLEVRVPFLDPRVMAAAFETPVTRHHRNGTGKVILRDILRHYVPDDLFDRPKSGFSVPVAAWLRQDLKNILEHYLSPDQLSVGGYLNTDAIMRRVVQHQAGTHNWQHSLWGVLMLQMWRERYKI